MKSCQVIVVEDDHELGELIVEVFSMELDCDVRLFTDGRSAMAWLQSDLCAARIPMLLVLDIHLPGVSGLEILGFLRSEERFDKTCIVMASADSIALSRTRGKADWQLLKPVSYSHFIEISRWFQSAMDLDIHCREVYDQGPGAS